MADRAAGQPAIVSDARGSSRDEGAPLGTVAVFSEDDRVRAEPFEAYELELAASWRL
jgi:hypothetical protein